MMTGIVFFHYPFNICFQPYYSAGELWSESAGAHQCRFVCLWVLEVDDLQSQGLLHLGHVCFPCRLKKRVALKLVCTGEKKEIFGEVMQDALTEAVGRHNSLRQSMKKVIEASQLQCNMALRQQNFELGYLKCMTESRDLIEWILRIQFVMLRLIRTAKREHYSSTYELFYWMRTLGFGQR